MPLLTFDPQPAEFAELPVPQASPHQLSVASDPGRRRHIKGQNELL